LDKNRLVRFMARVMEESGFKVYRNFQTSRHIIDIYGVLPTVLGDIGVVVACKNYDDRWEVGLDVLKEMEMVGKTLKASKIVVVTTSYFTNNAINYAGRRNIKIIDKDGLLALAKKFSDTSTHQTGMDDTEDVYVEEEEEVEYTPKTTSRNPMSMFSRGRQSLNRGGSRRSEFLLPETPEIRFLLTNHVSLIIIVIALSTLLTYLLSLGYKNAAIVGVAQILITAILSYGLALVAEKDFTKTLSKGTIVFFVALFVQVLLIIFL
jgi:hypothetical protein